MRTQALALGFRPGDSSMFNLCSLHVAGYPMFAAGTFLRALSSQPWFAAEQDSRPQPTSHPSRPGTERSGRKRTSGHIGCGFCLGARTQLAGHNIV